MVSQAEKVRRRKARTARAALEAAARPRPTPADVTAFETLADTAPGRGRRRPDSANRKTAIAGRDEGLDMLAARQRITPAQAEAGRWYGMLWRAANLADATPIRIADLVGSRGGGGSGVVVGAADEAVAWIADCRTRLAQVRTQVLQDDEDHVRLMDLICGHGLRPREISVDQRQTEQMESALRVLLDLVWRRFGADVRAWTRVRQERG